jgi:predicted DsbA family dithiol-disulfide isomerase
MSGTPLSIDLFSDLGCPWCYVGWAALKAAVRRRPDLAVHVAWRPFLLHPDLPPEGIERGPYIAAMTANDPERIQKSSETLRDIAANLDVPINLSAPQRVPNTVNAHRLIHWAAGQGSAEAVIDALFTAYWVDGADLGDKELLVALAAAAGLDGPLVAELLASDADTDVIHKQHAAAVAIGIRGVPAAIFAKSAVVMGAETPEGYLHALDAASAA